MCAAAKSPTPFRERLFATRLHASLLGVAVRLAAFRPFGVRPDESAMQFSHRGKLSCVCMPPNLKRPSPERRQSCRRCGLHVRNVSRNVDRQLTQSEIKAVVRGLRLAGIRSAALEIPAGVATLRQLNAYLASGAVKLPKVPIAIVSSPETASTSPVSLN
jgi:hypothetical protein